MCKRKTRTYDLRPLIEALTVIEPSPEGNQRLLMRLTAREGATYQPKEVLKTFEIDPAKTYIQRTKLHFKEPEPAG